MYTLRGYCENIQNSGEDSGSYQVTGARRYFDAISYMGRYIALS